jgi:hypothetical protein
MAYFIRVDAETDVIYELIAGPVQEPFAGEPQPEEVVNQAPGETTNPADLQGKPRSITFIFKYSMLLFKYCALSF